MKLVLDTNALVYALQDAYSDWAKVLQRVLSGQDQLCLDGRTFKEYRDVLYLPRLGFERARVNELLKALNQLGKRATPVTADWTQPDPDDVKFAEVAVAGGADYLVSQNLKDYVGFTRIPVVTAAQYLQLVSPTAHGA